MKPIGTLLLLFALASTTAGFLGRAAAQPTKKEAGAEKPAPKLDLGAIQKLVDQLKSGNFKTRQGAENELLKLDQVPDVLRAAAKSNDLETRRRAQKVVEAITTRLEEKAFQAMLADLHKVEVDRFVRRMVTDEKFAGDKEWKMIETLAKAVTKRANELGGINYPVPDFDMRALPLADLAVERVGFGGKRILLDNYTGSITGVNGSVVLCTGTMPRVTGLTNSIIIVDGDMIGATMLDKCLVIVSGKLGRFTNVRNSIILVKGEFGVTEDFRNANELRGSTVCRSSFLQTRNEKIRFTACDDCVLIKTIPIPARTNNRVLDTEKGPLTLLKFSEQKAIPDDKLNWGKEVNGLEVAIAPAERNYSFLVRWKNVGKKTLELRFVRSNIDALPPEFDDLRNHVLVKGQDGKLLAAKKPRFPARNVGAPRRPNSVILQPGKTHEETIELAQYVEQPAISGQHELSIELEVTEPLAPIQKNATYWTGKVQSNALKIMFGK